MNKRYRQSIAAMARARAPCSLWGAAVGCCRCIIVAKLACCLACCFDHEFAPSGIYPLYVRITLHSSGDGGMCPGSHRIAWFAAGFHVCLLLH